MKNALIALGAMLVFSLQGLPASAAGAAAGPDAAEATILELDKSWYEIRIARDVAAIDSLLADEFTTTTSYGRLVTKAELIERYRSREHSFRIRSYKTEEVKVKLYADVAVVTGRASVDWEAPDGRIASPSRFIRVYARADGRWRLAAQQQTRIIR
jgi:ketosteroid isomerase-like protein